MMIKAFRRLFPSIVAVVLLVSLVMGSFCTMLINADDQTIMRGIGLELIFAILSTLIGIAYLKIDQSLVADFRYMLWLSLVEMLMLIIYTPLAIAL